MYGLYVIIPRLKSISVTFYRYSSIITSLKCVLFCWLSNQPGSHSWWWTAKQVCWTHQAVSVHYCLGSIASAGSGWDSGSARPFMAQPIITLFLACEFKLWFCDSLVSYSYNDSMWNSDKEDEQSLVLSETIMLVGRYSSVVAATITCPLIVRFTVKQKLLVNFPILYFKTLISASYIYTEYLIRVSFFLVAIFPCLPGFEIRIKILPMKESSSSLDFFLKIPMEIWQLLLGFGPISYVW